MFQKLISLFVSTLTQEELKKALEKLEEEFKSELKKALSEFLEIQVEARVLQQDCRHFAIQLATEEQILTDLREAIPPDLVEIKRTERRIANFEFMKMEAETIQDELRSALKDKAKNQPQQ